MTTLFDSQLSCRDYASRLLHVGELLEWAKSNRLHLRTTPPIDKGEFIQVENLLCAIERHASNLTPEQALDVVLNDPVLKNDPALQKYSDDIDPVRCLWLIGAAAHQKWRELLSTAIQNQELSLLDFGSKLPIQTAPTQTGTTPAPVVAGGKKWTDEKLAELKTYREAHTMPETAVKFRISKQRIRELLPSEKAKAKPFAGLTHRMK